jgi:hypothetical protein
MSMPTQQIVSGKASKKKTVQKIDKCPSCGTVHYIIKDGNKTSYKDHSKRCNITMRCVRAITRS